MDCVRCNYYENEKGSGKVVMHHYEWTPPDFSVERSMFFNVEEIRFKIRTASCSEIITEQPPYFEDLISLIKAHEMVPEHEYHILREFIKPSLVGNVSFTNRITGAKELSTLMLDGHHSALRCMKEGWPVQMEIVPVEIMNFCKYNSHEEMMNSPVVVLRKAGSRTYMVS